MSVFNSLRDFERRLSGVVSSDQHWPRLRGEQVAAYQKLVPYGLVASACNAVVILVYFSMTTHDLRLWLWAITIGGVSLFGARSGIVALRKRYKMRLLPKSVMLRPIQESLALGLAWGFAPFLLLNGADGWQTVIVLVVCAGMMAGGAYMLSSIPRASLVFVASISGGVTSGMVLDGIQFEELAVLLLLLSYTAVMIRSSYWNFGNYIRSWLQQIELETQAIELERQKELVSVLLKDFEETASDSLWEINEYGYFGNVSDGLLKLCGLSRDELHLTGLTRILDRQALPDKSEIQRLSYSFQHQIGFTDILLPIRNAGQTRWWNVTGKPVIDSGVFKGYRGVVSDVTDAKEAEARISYLAHYDSLTDLPNRQNFNQAIERCFYKQSTTGEAFAVISVDLDFFKTVNDVHGHDVGDDVLRKAADIIREHVEDRDAVARVGGDEFAIIQRDVQDQSNVLALCDRLIDAFSQPIKAKGVLIDIGISLGIAFCPQDASTIAGLLKCADLALYRAKHDGRNRVCSFEPEMDIIAKERRLLEVELKTALNEGQFALYFQPLVDSQTSKVKAFEALLRWNHPVRGLIAPDHFIKVTEQTGMIVAIGEWVIRSAIEEASTWDENTRVSINLSPIQVKHKGLLAVVTQALAASQLDPRRVEFEITESVLLESSKEAIDQLHSLRSLGIQIALDDFGTGYSSLSYLRSFPFDRIKIDKSFVQAIADSTECRAIVLAVASLARSLGMESTAEGVETQEQATHLRDSGCTELQGFLFSRPAPPHQLEARGILTRKQSANMADKTDLESPPLQSKAI